MSGAAAALLALGALAALLAGWRDRPVPAAGSAPPALPDGAGLSRADVEAISVVVPARDEEAVLSRLLDSLRAQEHPAAEVVVVDDGSSDATAAVAREGGATVVPAGELPPGWAGKPWACRQGVEAAAHERLVLLDADTWLAPDGLARLLAAHDALAPDGLLSVQPHHHVERPYEQLSLFANVVPLLASGTWLPGRRARGSSRAVAFGPCLVTTREALAAAGGFEAVAGEVLEDAALARAYRAAGRPVATRTGAEAVGFRMYPAGLGQLVEGWTKNLAGGAARAPVIPTVAAAVWVTALAALSVEAATRPAPWVAVAWVAAAAQVGWLARRTGTFSPWAWLLFPLPLWAFVALCLRSLWHRTVRRRVSWRGRTISTGRRP